PDESVPVRPLIVHVARLMPIKHQATVIRALAEIVPDTDAEVAFIGGVPDNNDLNYLTGLERLAAQLGVSDRVTFTGALPAEEVRDWYRRAAVAVNPSPVGLFDKAALESMATGVPTIVSSPAFDSLLGEYVPQLRIDSPEDVTDLADRLWALLTHSPEEHYPMTQAIRERVEAHSLEQLMVRLVNVFRDGEP
ncbi:MAG: glycosyltransferase, partial [Anaerolineae bacterium]|nr:glycosyltransferase [Anaerolineae bacterium]